jgi:rare lipoprotein A
MLAPGQLSLRQDRPFRPERTLRPSVRGGCMRPNSVLEDTVAQTANLPAKSRPASPIQAAARVVALSAVALTAANCSSPKVSSSGRTIDPKYGVAASPRVVGENDPVPKGGGRELVGRPYVIAGRTYVPRDNPAGYKREGLASWYGAAFHGRLTANGEIFDRYSLAAAHPTLPLPSYARVTNLQNNHSIIVRVNDRGPYHADRLMDVSQTVAEALDFRNAGTTRVRVEYVGRASIRGSDDAKLLATLRTDGRSTPLPGQAATMMADAGHVAPQAPRAALAFKSAPGPGPSEEAEESAAPTMVAEKPAPRVAPILLAAASPNPAEGRSAAAENRTVTLVPMPPERPFDFGTIPNAATPVRAPAPARLSQGSLDRSTMAGLFFAGPDRPLSAFTAEGAFVHLRPQRFVPFRSGEGPSEIDR